MVQRVVESVRVLDTAQANTSRALERTVDIVGLKTCVEQVTAAMQVGRARATGGRSSHARGGKRRGVLSTLRLTCRRNVLRTPRHVDATC